MAGKKFEDQSFPANQNSLGLDVKGDWKRISHIIDHPKLFAGEIRPRDVIRTNRGGCYFVSTLGALAENGQAIKEIFRGQEFNPKGIYKVMLRIAGDVEEVIVDDYIPVNEEG